MHGFWLGCRGLHGGGMHIQGVTSMEALLSVDEQVAIGAHEYLCSAIHWHRCRSGSSLHKQAGWVCNMGSLAGLS